MHENLQTLWLKPPLPYFDHSVYIQFSVCVKCDGGAVVGSRRISCVPPLRVSWNAKFKLIGPWRSALSRKGVLPWRSFSQGGHLNGSVVHCYHRTFPNGRGKRKQGRIDTWCVFVQIPTGIYSTRQLLLCVLGIHRV